MQESGVGFLGQEDSLEKEMASYSSVLAWNMSWTEKPVGLQSMESQKSQIRLSDQRTNECVL